MVGEYLEKMQADDRAPSANSAPGGGSDKLQLEDNVSSYLIGKVLEKAGHGKSPDERMKFAISIPQMAKRDFYDDTTVTVVFLGPKTRATVPRELPSEPNDIVAGTDEGRTNNAFDKPAIVKRIEGLLEQKAKDDRAAGAQWQMLYEHMAGTPRQ